MRLITLPDPETLAHEAAQLLSSQIHHAVEQRGEAHIALSGGTTPRRTYQLLRDAIDLGDAVELWFADERCVPPDHPDSNYRLVDETLLRRAAAKPPAVHRMQGELGPDQGAARYASELCGRLLVGEPTAKEGACTPVLDLIVLGIGEDGHIASLFPHASVLDAPAEAVCHGIHDSPKPPPQRITLSLPVLRAARSCLLLATGAGKADALRGALGAPSKGLPASLLARDQLTILLDEQAASMLGPDA